MSTLTRATLTSLTLFKDVAPNTLDKLIQVGRISSHARGDYIFLEKEHIHTFYIVLEGIVSLYKTNSNGHIKTIFMLGRDHLINESLFGHLPTAINCRVYHPCVLLTIQSKDLLPLMAQDFVLTQNLVMQLSRRIRRLYRQSKNATSIIKIEKKLAAKIWKLAQDYGIPDTQGVKIDIPITITALSELLGSYRETTSRALKILVQAQLVRYDQKYLYIPDPDALSLFFKTS